MRYWLLLSCCFSSFFVFGNSFSLVKPITVVTGRPNLSIGFLLKRTVSINQKACSCQNAFSCSCCQSVTILVRGSARNLCVNFTYANTGLSMSILLGSKTIRYVSVIDYRAFKVCTSIPDCQYSFACVDVMEVSLYPKSVTICMQLDITSKNLNWLINYNCISISTLLSNQSFATNMQPMGMPGNGQMPAGQMPSGQMPAGQMPAGQMPSGQMPQGQMPAGQMPSGQMPQGQMPAGQMPSGQMPQGQMPAGQMPSGQMPQGQMPAGQMPSGQMPQGQMPQGQMPQGQMPQGQMPQGQMPQGQMPQGQMPQGQIPPRQMQPGRMPIGPIPPNRMQRTLTISGGVQKPIFRNTERVPELLNWVLSRKSRAAKPGARTVRKSLNTRGLIVGGNGRSINILSINEIRKDTGRGDARVLDDRKIPTNHYPTTNKIKFRNNFDERNEVIPEDHLSIKLLNHRAKRNIKKQSNSPVKMQVILRSRKTRIPKTIIGNDSMRSFKTSATYIASRSSKIVNQDTISIPMFQSGLGNLMVSDATSSNNAIKSVDNGNQVEFVPPQLLPALPTNAFPSPPPVLVLEDTTTVEKPTLPDFYINYDNRTSSFPDRMPPSFGMGSRIGPNVMNRPLQPFERDVEELETVGPEIALHPNSKIVEMSSADLSDGKMIFPE